MTTITDDSAQESKAFDMDSFLKGYDTPMTVTNAPTQGPISEPRHKDTLTPDNISNQEATEYYVRGPKKGQPKPKRTPTKITYNAPDTQNIGNEFLTGEMFMTLIDVVFPLLIATIHNMASKKVKINSDDLCLTDKQKKSLEALADKVAKGINIEANPVAALGVMLCAMYATKVISLRDK